MTIHLLALLVAIILLAVAAFMSPALRDRLVLIAGIAIAIGLLWP